MNSLYLPISTTLATGVTISLMGAIVCVALHYEGLNILEKLAIIESRWLRHPRPRVILVMVGVVLLHFIEIALMALLYAILAEKGLGFVQQMSDIHGTFRPLDYLYFSGGMYTSLGLGDLVPHGIFRTLAPVEALIGLILIAWSASFTYLLMQRLWGRLPSR